MTKPPWRAAPPERTLGRAAHSAGGAGGRLLGLLTTGRPAAAGAGAEVAPPVLPPVVAVPLAGLAVLLPPGVVTPMLPKFRPPPLLPVLVAPELVVPELPLPEPVVVEELLPLPLPVLPEGVNSEPELLPWLLLLPPLLVLVPVLLPLEVEELEPCRGRRTGGRDSE